jgi:hypothetical protein
MSLYPSVRIEGGLLGPDLLDQLFAGELPGQRAADFRLAARRNLTDEIASAFTDARALWGVFQHRLERLAADDLATKVTTDAWLVPFLGLLGYDLRPNSKALEVDGLSFPISHRAGEAALSPPVHLVGARQELGRVPATGRPRMAPHSLVQDYLNRTENLWGIVTNGLTLRLLRNCTFVRRQAYVEFDLAGVLEEQRFQDFAALYRLLHSTRLPRGVEDANDCLLEKYYAHSVEQGGRVREHLRDGVEQCLTMLANGFLRHPRNDELRRRIAPSCTDTDRISPESLYRQLLVLVYRFLFLLVSEDRGLLSVDPLYREYYGIARLRRLLDHRAAFTDHDDLWQSLRVLWYVLASEQAQPGLSNQPMASALGLPVLNGDLFATQALDGCTITNRELLEALWRLTWYQESGSSVPRRVNYAALDVEELGSVYESLLEFHPAVDMDDAGRPGFRFVTGSERKTTGSYYTPPELVGELIKSALEPVISDRLSSLTKKEVKRKALLSIRVCDPACGSGHFLLAAARRLGRELARVDTGEDEPAPERVREAIREVVCHCICGVDKNPLAVDLCRVALWLESHTADKPLTFLDHRIRPGDSLVGVFDLAVLKDGIPDKAFDPLEGDDKATARELARRNREERGGIRDLQRWNPDEVLQDFNRQSRALDEIADDSPGAIHRKKDLYQRERASPAWQRQKQACDLWTAAFFQPLQPDQPAITTARLAENMAGNTIDGRLSGMARTFSDHQPFFHWPLEFPEVFADGGFDVVLSNPPWEQVELKEQEFFAARDARIALADTKAERTRLIRELATRNPRLHDNYVEALRALNGSRHFLGTSGRYPLTGRGRVNTYAVFAELGSIAVNRGGRSGLILPTGIATDENTKQYFSSLVQEGRLVDLVGFENEELIFSAVHHDFKFCKLTIGEVARPTEQSRIGFYIRRYAQLVDEDKFFTLSKSDFLLLNPNTCNCPIFRSQRDAELTKAIHRRVPVLWLEAADDKPEINPWRIKFAQGLFNMSSDSDHFRTAEKLVAKGFRLVSNSYVRDEECYLPLYEAKMLHQFDHRFSSYQGATERQLNVGILPQTTAEQKRDPSFVVQPRYWVREDLVESTIPKYPEPLAAAVQIGHRASIQRVLCWWAAGYHLDHGKEEEGDKLLLTANRFALDRLVERTFSANDPQSRAMSLARDFPLDTQDVVAVGRQLSNPESLVKGLLVRFSPNWFLGWCDITNAGNERTLIASALPRAAVGHTFPLIFSPGIAPRLKLLLLVNLNCLAADYAARQKVGRTHITYNLLKQFPILSPDTWSSVDRQGSIKSLSKDLSSLAIELVYTSHDLAPLARDCGFDGPPFLWDDDRRFEIRCELDAAFFHLYLPAENDGQWRPAEAETAKQLETLKTHFTTPRHAVGFILDQFPLVRQKDEKTHGCYRTKERILAIYDAMLAAQRSGKPYQSTLNPPPGEDSRAAKA